MSELFNSKAYHKAGYENAILSVRWQSFFASKGEHHWLGDGVYFWQNYEDAVWWDGKYVLPVIMIADLECERRLFLDLDDSAVRNHFYEYMKSAFAEFAKCGYSIRVDGFEKVTGASCNYYKEKNSIELIRYSFPDNSNRPQFCATNTMTAKNIRIVNGGPIQQFKEDPYEYI